MSYDICISRKNYMSMTNLCRSSLIDLVDNEDIPINNLNIGINRNVEEVPLLNMQLVNNILNGRIDDNVIPVRNRINLVEEERRQMRQERLHNMEIEHNENRRIRNEQQRLQHQAFNQAFTDTYNPSLNRISELIFEGTNVENNLIFNALKTENVLQELEINGDYSDFLKRQIQSGDKISLSLDYFIFFQIME